MKLTVIWSLNIIKGIEDKTHEMTSGSPHGISHPFARIYLLGAAHALVIRPCSH